MKARQGRGQSGQSDDRAVYIISVAAELAGVHPQTLRIYERKGLLSPARTAGNTRRYSERDIRRLQDIQRLTQEHGINLAGVKMIVEMENELEQMRQRVQRLGRELQKARVRARGEPSEPPGSAARADIVPLSSVPRLRVTVRRSVERGRGGVRRGPIAVGPGES